MIEKMDFVLIGSIGFMGLMFYLRNKAEDADYERRFRDPNEMVWRERVMLLEKNNADLTDLLAGFHVDAGKFTTLKNDALAQVNKSLERYNYLLNKTGLTQAEQSELANLRLLIPQTGGI